MGRKSAFEDVDAEQQGSVFPATKPKQKRNKATGIVMLMILAFSMFFLFLFATFNLEPVQSKESAAASKVTPSAPVAKGAFKGIVILRVGEKRPRKKSQALVGKPLESDVKMWRKPGKFLQPPLKAVFNWENILEKNMIPKSLQKVNWTDVRKKNMNQKQKNIYMLQKNVNGGNFKTVKGKLVKLAGGRSGILLQVNPGDGVKYHAASSDRKLKMKDDSDIIMLEDNNVEGVGPPSDSGKILRLDEFMKAADIDDDDEHEEEYFDNKSDEYVDNSQKEKLEKLKEGIILKFNQNLQNFGAAEAWGGQKIMKDGELFEKNTADVENNKAAERTLETKYTTSGKEEEVRGGELGKKYTTAGADEEIGAGNYGLELEKELAAPEDGGTNKTNINKIGKGKRRREIVIDGKPEKLGKKKGKRKAKNKKRKI